MVTVVRPDEGIQLSFDVEGGASGCHLRKRMSGRLWERVGRRRYFLRRWPFRSAMQRIRRRVKKVVRPYRNGVKDVRVLRPPLFASVLAALACAVAPACISTESDRGIQPSWKQIGADALVDGETTRNEVLELLGPPSQILSLGEETAFYYMLEKTRGRGVILIVYNDRSEKTVYERAVFFFDREGVLTEHAFGE